MKIQTKNLLIVIPHAGLKRPKEIPARWLSRDIEKIIETETDWYTDLLYDFREILSNNQLIFPINQVFINACRHPGILDSCVPLNVNGNKIYTRNPSAVLRRKLVKRYLDPFYEKIQKTRKTFILDCHSFVKGSLDNEGKEIKNDIILTDIVTSNLDPKGGLKTAPEGYLDFYRRELKKRLPELTIGKNSFYNSVYDHILAMNSWDGIRMKGNRVPIIHQETNEKLYISNGKPDMKAIARLKRAFSDSVYQTMKHFYL